MSINDIDLVRIYKCGNDECDCKVAAKEKSGDPWQTTCPFCEQESLYLDSAESNFSILIGTKTPKTLGMIGQVNQARREREIEKEKKQKPFWRDKKKVDFNVLKNPKNYIETGYT